MEGEYEVVYELLAILIAIFGILVVLGNGKKN